MQPLELRLTHKYVGTYQHEDEWKVVGDYGIMNSQKWVKVEDDEPDITEPETMYYWVKVTPEFGVPQEEVRQALKDSFTSSGCHHEYDCCGCRSFYSETPELMSQDGDCEVWKVKVNSWRNY
jgi:hypothetical protein